MLALIIALGTLILSLFSYLAISRRLCLFLDEDKVIFQQFFSKKVANILIKIFIPNGKNNKNSGEDADKVHNDN